MVELFFWTFLAATPAFAANMSPVFAKKLNIFKFLDYPVDFKKTFLGKRISGDHKTFRGIVIGTISGLLASLLLYFLIPRLPACLPNGMAAEGSSLAPGEVEGLLIFLAPLSSLSDFAAFGA